MPRRAAAAAWQQACAAHQQRTWPLRWRSLFAECGDVEIAGVGHRRIILKSARGLKNVLTGGDSDLNVLATLHCNLDGGGKARDRRILHTARREVTFICFVFFGPSLSPTSTM